MKNHNTTRNNSKGYNNYTSATITNNSHDFTDTNSKAIIIIVIIIVSYNNSY